MNNFQKSLFNTQVNLSKYTTLKIGGQADSFFVVSSEEDICDLLNVCGDDFYVLGNGSNLLVRDDIVLRKSIIFLGERFAYLRMTEQGLEVGAKTMLSELLQFCFLNDLGGIYKLVGIPATVGGLIAMNASAYGISISMFIKQLELVTSGGKIKTLGKEEIDFWYRATSLNKCIILRVWLDLPKENKVKEKTAQAIKQRIASQDLLSPSCGCVFKNPQPYSAGYLIDATGLKGFSRNDAQISIKHANFIINRGKATYQDVDFLINLIKDKVYNKFSVMLEEEVKRWA